MSKLSQFFGGGSQKMDVDVLILSGGGGGAVSSGPAVSPSNGQAQSGVGGGGAVFQGTIPIIPGSTVPIVVGGGGAGHSTPNVCLNGAMGGCSKLTFPEGTICVMGGGGGATAGTALCPTPGMPYTAGTGGSGGGRCMAYGPGSCTCAPGFGNAGSVASQGGRSVYGTGRFTDDTLITTCVFMCYNNTCSVDKLYMTSSWSGTDVMNHKYGQFSGGAAAGGFQYSFTLANNCCKCNFNSRASGGAGGPGAFMQTGPGGGWWVAGPGVCSDISGVLQEYGKGAAFGVFSATQDANTGNGGTTSGPGTQASGSGAPGTVIVRYPTQFAAAPSSPGAVNCSPETPGYHTYKFNSTGSITLPT